MRSFTPAAAGLASAGAKRLVSNGGGTHPRWREDGHELFYLAPDGTVMAVNLTLEAALDSSVPRRLFQLPLNHLWDVDTNGQRFLFAIPVDQGHRNPSR